jgi:hypothetical protein
VSCSRKVPGSHKGGIQLNEKHTQADHVVNKKAPSLMDFCTSLDYLGLLTGGVAAIEQHVQPLDIP